jgi:septal ring factor EnvC (AmiA/AmiB activator)
MLMLLKSVPIYVIAGLLGGMGILYLQNASKAETIEEKTAEIAEHKETIRLDGIKYSELQGQLVLQNEQILKMEEETLASEKRMLESKTSIKVINDKLGKILTKMDEEDEEEDALSVPMTCEAAMQYLLQKSMEDLTP